MTAPDFEATDERLFALAESYVIYVAGEDRNLGCVMRAQANEIARLTAERDEARAEVKRLHARLEDDHVYRIDDETGGTYRVDVEPGSIPDGIKCRDATIRGLDDRIRNLTTERDAARAAAKGLAEALRDMSSGWDYIRGRYGDLAGVGWSRAADKADTALAAYAATGAGE